MIGLAEAVQEIIQLAAARAVAEMAYQGPLLTGPEDAGLADGVIVDGEIHAVCLFDDDQTGFDNEEAGFA
ncbi:MAG: hypothetical protein U9R79_10415 [Armatimonadota bacterium]|nr:hypothetical protein [Armatimonadota bacterium]